MSKSRLYTNIKYIYIYISISILIYTTSTLISYLISVDALLSKTQKVN